MKTPTLLTILLATSKAIHTNTTTPTITTRERPDDITFAHNDSRQHFDSIKVPSLDIGNLQSLDNTSPMPRTLSLLIMSFVTLSTSSTT
jgi:hypothetical protein